MEAINPLEGKVLLGAGLLTLYRKEGLARGVEFFAQLYGLLLSQDGDSESLDFWAALIYWLDQNTSGERPRSKPIKLGTIQASIIPSASGVPILKLVPRDLASAILVQMGQSLASGSKVVACAACGTYFEVGAGAGRRADAKFCSDSCRYRQHNYYKAKKPKRRAR